jgi:hypothetical protein
MSTAGYIALAASWVLIAVLLLLLRRMSARQGHDESRTADRLDALQAQYEALAAARELSDPQPAIGGSASDKSADVPLITGISEPDDAPLSTARVASITLAGPIMKVAAFTYGLRYALHEERRMRVSYVMRKELRHQRKMRRRRRAQRSPSEEWVS